MTMYTQNNPIIVQGDYSILLEVNNPAYASARNALVQFAELVKSPEYIHTYRITPLSIWNACAAGVRPETITRSLREYSKYDVPEHVVTGILDFASRYGRLTLSRDDRGLVLSADDPALAEEISRERNVSAFLGERYTPLEFLVRPVDRGRLKQALVKVGFPAEDIAGYVQGEELRISLRQITLEKTDFSLRPYQIEAAEAFHASGSNRGGSGVVVLPCGAGKTIVGIACMNMVQSSTLILTTSVTASRQWIAELMDKTSLTEDLVGEYGRTQKDVFPVTVATYNMMTHRRSRDSEFMHLSLFDRRNWGLIIYDEVHVLPAPVFQVTAGLQARRRLGLTATLVREDGREDDVFALIGPKKIDIPWKDMERQGWIARAVCTEIRVPMPENLRMPYAISNARQKFRVASENPDKLEIVRKLLDRHRGEQILVISMYVDQIKDLAESLGIPVITGSTPQRSRDRLFEDFRQGSLRQLAVSKIANFALDLPDASVAIQVSGTFGSRQEEAQRLGRILRPKTGINQAHFYTIVSRDTVEQNFALNRQLFLCEQGYEYVIVPADTMEDF